MKQAILIAIIFVSFSLANAGGVYVGVVDGYAHYLDGSKVSGVNISVYVDGCSGEACFGSYFTEADPSSLGYYVIGNLNIPSEGTVHVIGTKGTYYGSVYGASTTNYVGRVNITLVAVPSVPKLTANFTDTHPPIADVICEPYPDPNGLTAYVEMVIDGVTVSNTTSLYDETEAFDFGSHELECRACNDYICSNWNSTSFAYVNTPPSVPTLVNQNDTTQTSVTLNWTSGIDPEGDLVYNNYSFDSVIKIPDAATYSVEIGLTQPAYYTWGVRTCDIYGACSDWVYDTFLSYTPGTNITCPPCDCSGGSGSSGGGGGACSPAYNIYISYPYYVYQDDEINISAFVNATVDLKNFNFTIIPDDLSIQLIDSDIETSNKTASTYFIFNTSIKTPKTVKFTFIADKDKTIVQQKEFYIDIRQKPLIEIMREEQMEYVIVPILPLEILMFVIITIAFIYYYKQIKKIVKDTIK